MKHIHTHYDNLKVTRDAPIVVIRGAYRALCRQFHPDRNPDNTEAARIMSIINASYAVLSDPEQRRQHDLWISEEERSYGRNGSTDHDYRYAAPRPEPASAQQAEARQETPRRGMQKTTDLQRGVTPDAQPRKYGARAIALLSVAIAGGILLYIHDEENRTLKLEHAFSKAIPATARAWDNPPKANSNEATPDPVLRNRSLLDWEKK